MFKTKKIVCVIPARLNAQRFPQKLLSQLGRKPLLEWVWNAAKQVKLFDDVLFAIDDAALARLIDSFNGKWVMTSAHCQSGTDRLIDVLNKGIISADVWVNWQGDEPFISSAMIDELLQSCDDKADVWTLRKKIIDSTDLTSRNCAKVVCDAQGYALYFSRNQIPCFRDEQDTEKLVKEQCFYKHVGIYAYTTNALVTISNMGDCFLENAEKLEQLRQLYYGLRIKAHITETEVIGIDTPDDLIRAEKRIKTQRSTTESLLTTI